MKPLDDRQTGRTTAQMKAAAHGATFVWCNDALTYPKDLARGLGRADLRIEPFSAMEDGGARLFGRECQIVLDHALTLNDRTQDGMFAVDHINARFAQRAA